MDNYNDTVDADGEHPRGFGALLLIVRGFIERLVKLVSLTQQDLMDAGISFRQTRD
jgi:hypothetical protein